MTLRPRRDVLEDYVTILQRIYAPVAFFARVRRFGRALGTGTSKTPAQPSVPSRAGGGLAHFLSELTLTDLREGLGVVRGVARHPKWLIPFGQTIADCAWHNPAAIKAVFNAVALYLHAGPFSLQVIRILNAKIAAIDAGRWQRPPLVPATPAQEPVTI